MGHNPPGTQSCGWGAWLTPERRRWAVEPVKLVANQVMTQQEQGVCQPTPFASLWLTAEKQETDERVSAALEPVGHSWAEYRPPPLLQTWLASRLRPRGMSVQPSGQETHSDRSGTSGTHYSLAPGWLQLADLQVIS